MAAPAAKTVSLQAIAEFFGVTTEGIRLWRKSGMPSRTFKVGKKERLAFVVAECIEWRRLKDREDYESKNGPSESVERTRKLTAEADLKELELAEKRGRMVDLSVLRETVEKVAGGLAAAVAGRLSRFERDYVACDSPARARQINQEIQTQLMSAAREFGESLLADADAAENG